MQVVLPAKYSKNGKAGTLLFYSPRLRNALEEYVAFRVKKRLMMSGNSDDYRGLRKDSKLILSENKHGYALKKKDGSIVNHWACDTLQAVITQWGKDAGIPDFSSHSGRRILAARIAHLKATELTLCTVLRHSTLDMPYAYIESDDIAEQKILEELYSVSTTK